MSQDSPKSQRWNRRTVLSATAAGLAGLAGCSGGGTEDSQSPDSNGGQSPDNGDNRSPDSTAEGTGDLSDSSDTITVAENTIDQLSIEDANAGELKFKITIQNTGNEKTSLANYNIRVKTVGDDGNVLTTDQAAKGEADKTVSPGESATIALYLQSVSQSNVGEYEIYLTCFESGDVPWYAEGAKYCGY